VYFTLMQIAFQTTLFFLGPLILLSLIVLFFGDFLALFGVTHQPDKVVNDAIALGKFSVVWSILSTSLFFGIYQILRRRATGHSGI